jgi:hypothetical protein
MFEYSLIGIRATRSTYKSKIRNAATLTYTISKLHASLNLFVLLLPMLEARQLHFSAKCFDTTMQFIQTLRMEVCFISTMCLIHGLPENSPQEVGTQKPTQQQSRQS